MAVVKVMDLIGSSTESWDDAARQAVMEAAKTVRGITGAEVISQSAEVSENDITEYRTTVRLAFKVER